MQARLIECDRHAQYLANQQQLLNEKRFLIEEFKLNLITRDEYRQAVLRLEYKFANGGSSENQPPPLLLNLGGVKASAPAMTSTNPLDSQSTGRDVSWSPSPPQLPFSLPFARSDV